MLRKYRGLKPWKKIAFVLVLAAGAAVACSLLWNWPIRFKPRWATGSLAAANPSGGAPDNIVLVPAGDMSSSISITWRTSDRIPDGIVQYRKLGDAGDEVAEARAARTDLLSMELKEDRTVHCFSATLTGLAPGTAYSYRAGSKEQNVWSEHGAFTTAEKAPESFSFVYMADTQIAPVRVGAMLDAVEERHPETAFHMNSGDIVDRGELRNLWDDFIAGTHGIFSRKPFVPAMGNHDPGNRKYGAAIFNAYFNTPGRNPKRPYRVENYSFRYGAAFFIVINQFDVSDQTEWLEKELQIADAAGAEFKIVMFHHPVYNPGKHRSNDDAQEEWVPLFDKYGVDLVLTGHDHSYVRSMALKGGKPVPAGEFGTTYITSTACDKFYEYKELETAAIQFANVATYQIITLSVGGGGEAGVRYRAYSSDSKIMDEFAYTKP